LAEDNMVKLVLTPSEYLLLIRGTHWEKDLSPKEIQKFMSQA